jgi:hypothetical protein
MTPRDPSTTTPVETSTGTEHRPIDALHITRQHGQRAEPSLRPGEQAFHTIDGRCHVINTARTPGQQP